MAQRQQPLQKNEHPTHPFSTPEGYFDDFKTRMLQRVQEEKSIPAVASEPPSRLTLLKPYLYLAAMFVGMMLMFKALSGDFLPTSPAPHNVVATTEEEMVPPSLTEEDLDAYFNHETSNVYLATYVFSEE